jgi:uracil phosphoribosyltransferase
MSSSALDVAPVDTLNPGPPALASGQTEQTIAFPHVAVCHHPLVQHNLTLLRDSQTDAERFRAAMARVGGFLLQEATRELPVVSVLTQTPLCTTQTQILDPSVSVVMAPILRAGLTFADIALQLVPSAKVYHIGLYRNEETLEPVTYYNKLPNGNSKTLDYTTARVFVLDPMLATGGSAIAALDILKGLGVDATHVTFVCLIASPEGIAALYRAHPEVKVYTGAVDDCLNDKGYILPGLGDAGDRAYSTH